MNWPGIINDNILVPSCIIRIIEAGGGVGGGGGGRLHFLLGALLFRFVRHQV